MAQQWEQEMNNFSFDEKDKFIEWAPCSPSKTPVMADQTQKKIRRRPGKESRRRNQIKRRKLQREYILRQKEKEERDDFLRKEVNRLKVKYEKIRNQRRDRQRNLEDAIVRFQCDQSSAQIISNLRHQLLGDNESG